MKLRGQVIFGAIVIIIGLAVLLANVLGVDAGTVCFPTVLILIGLWILFRPRLSGPGAALKVRIFGPIRRKGAWQVRDEETMLFLGDVTFDLSYFKWGMCRIASCGLIELPRGDHDELEGEVVARVRAPAGRLPVGVQQ